MGQTYCSLLSSLRYFVVWEEPRVHVSYSQYFTDTRAVSREDIGFHIRARARYVGCLKEASKSVQVLLTGIF